MKVLSNFSDFSVNDEGKFMGVYMLNLTLNEMQCCHIMQQSWFHAIWMKIDTKQSLLLLRRTQESLMTESFLTKSSSFLFIGVGWRVVVGVGMGGMRQQMRARLGNFTADAKWSPERHREGFWEIRKIKST